jgi:zona occludens toxin (predicted ATPase)
MTIQNWRRVAVALLLSVVLLVTGCQPKAPSQFSQAQQESTQKGVTAVAKDATQGSEFNKFFPRASEGYSRAFSQEKKGFAEAKLNKGGKNVAMLSISDTTSIPAAAAKYKSATEKVAGYPIVDQGTTQTGLLVGKYQVKVISRDPEFDKADRRAWLQKFDLKGLEKLN